jgi:hypothetical protein
MNKDTLVNRLRGIYTVGPNAEFGVRSFADFVPPISLEAAIEIEQLETKLKWVYCNLIGSDSIIGIDSCADFKDWLENLTPQ